MFDVARALELWVEITGVDPTSNSFRFRDYDVYQMNRELKQSVDYDPSKFTTIVLMKHFLKGYLEEKKFTVQSILDDYDNLTNYLETCRDLLGLLESDEIEESIQDFQTQMVAALKHYDVEREAVFAVANNSYELALLRRDALRSIETLTVDQFLQGNPEGENPIYYRTVHEFWSIHTLIQYACRMKSGISLNLIRDPKADSTYFAFVVRNGGTLSILTDKPQYDHPMQKFMSRSRASGRNFAERIERHHFPYSLMDIEFGDNGRAYVMGEDRSLVPFKDEGRPMLDIKDLLPDEVIWIVMVFSLIEEKFFKNNFRTPELSYTGEMVRVSSIALDAAKEHQLAVSSYMMLEAPSLTASDITTEKMLDEWASEPTRQYEWIEKRYLDKIPNTLLNFVGRGVEKTYLMTAENKFHADFKSEILALPGEKTEELPYAVVQLTDEQIEQRLPWTFDRDDFKKTMKLASLDPTMFGTAKEVLADQRWIARYNMIKLLQIELDKEYHARKDEIIAWYQEMVTKNLPNLYRAIAEGEFIVPSVYEHRFASEPSDRGGNILDIYGSDVDDHHRKYNHKIRISSWHTTSGNYGCMYNRSAASIIARFRPHSPEALALLCGCGVDELPDILQHWTDIEQYSGNSILERLDPLEWAIQNPWAKLNLQVGVYLSKSGYTAICKNHGREPNKFWIAPKDPNARQVFVKPKAGDEVDFTAEGWRLFNTREPVPERPHLGVVVQVVRDGRVNGHYKIKRNHDGAIIDVYGYKNLLVPERKEKAGEEGDVLSLTRISRNT